MQNNTELHIASLFDKNYVIRALALYESACRYIPNAQVWFLCLDDESYDLISKLNLANLHLRKIGEIGDKDLLNLRASRSAGEFAFTAKSSWVAYIINTGIPKENDVVAWMDADILFYSDLQVFLENFIQKYSIGISPHKFSKEREKMVGKYNAGMIFFKNDAFAKECLKEWRKQCIEWCFSRLEDGKLGDQMYLDKWQEKYKRVYDIPDKGINLGSWNISRYKITKNNKGEFFVDNDPLICYHFHGLKFFLGKNKKIKPFPINVYNQQIYNIYINHLQMWYQKILDIDQNWHYEFSQKPDSFRLLKQKFIHFLFVKT